MERKNTVLLTVIAVATLLVAVVGATFAYFTATSDTSDASKGQATIDTTSLAKVQLTATSLKGNSDVKLYPGTKNFIGASVTASKTGGEGDEYEVHYTISGKVTPSEEFTQGSVTYELYRTSSPVSTPVTCPEPTAKTVGNEVRYTRVCTNASELSSGLELTSGTKIATTQEDAFTYTDTIIADGNTTYYYYLVVTYEDKGDSTDQSEDATKSITLSIDSVTATSTNVKAGD